jgi:hydrogenase maturation protease
MKVLVLGIGSPFADDRAGWRVSDQLSCMESLQKLLASGQLRIEAENRPGLDLLVWLQEDYQHIILVDMVKTNLLETGNIYVLKAKEIIGFSGMLSSHNLGVSPSLALAEVLGIKIDNIIFYGIEGERYKPEEVMSQTMLAAVAKVTTQIEQHILELFA